MFTKSFGSRLLALALVLVMGLMGCSSGGTTGVTGNYSQDTLKVIEDLTTVMELPPNDPSYREKQTAARDEMNSYISRYRRDDRVSGLTSFTTMQTALNSLAGFYSSYGSRPVSSKLKKRLLKEFGKVERSINRGF